MGYDTNYTNLIDLSQGLTCMQKLGLESCKFQYELIAVSTAVAIKDTIDFTEQAQ